MTTHTITTKPGCPVHPTIAHLNALPTVPGMVRYWWNTYTKAQLLEVLPRESLGEPLPGKGKALFIAPACGELTRITKAPGSPTLYAYELFRRA